MTAATRAVPPLGAESIGGSFAATCSFCARAITDLLCSFGIVVLRILCISHTSYLGDSSTVNSRSSSAFCNLA